MIFFAPSGHFGCPQGAIVNVCTCLFRLSARRNPRDRVVQSVSPYILGGPHLSLLITLQQRQKDASRTAPAPAPTPATPCVDDEPVAAAVATAVASAVAVRTKPTTQSEVLAATSLLQLEGSNSAELSQKGASGLGVRTVETPRSQPSSTATSPCCLLLLSRGTVFPFSFPEGSFAAIAATQPTR